jgi:hypothetical protein
MTVVSSYEAVFKSVGTQEVMKSFTDVQKSAALADRQAKVNAQNLRDYGKSQIQTQMEIARAAQQAANAQAKAAEKTKYAIIPGLAGAADATKAFISQNALLISGLAAVGTAGVKAYQTFQAYAGSVRDVALASGTSATEASKLLQVLDDYEITAEDVMKATKAMTKNGLEPSMETLAKLADQYVAIQDPMKKNEFILKNLGKAGLEWANALNQGGDALRSASASINENLILTDEQIKKSEKARLAIDTLSDAWEGMKVAVGGAIGDAIVMNQQMEDYQRVTGKAAQQNGILTESFKRYQNEAEKGAAMTEYAKRMYDDLHPSMETSAEDADALVEKQKALEASSRTYMSTLSNVSSETEKFTEKNAELTSKLQELEAQLAGEKVGSEKYVELQGEIEDTKNSITELADEHAKASQKIIFDLISQQAAAEGFKTISVEALAALGEQMGVLEKGSTAATTSMISQAQAWASALELAGGQLASLADMYAGLQKLAKSGVTLTANVVSAATGGAMGGANTMTTCFTGDTPVTMADRTTKHIKDIVVGDRVISYDTANDKQLITTVIETFEHTAEEAGTILLINGYLKVTTSHLLWNGFQWRAAGKFQKGDYLFNLDGSMMIVKSIRQLAKREKVYNLHVDHNVHNYFAGGVLVHNAKAAGLASGGLLSGGWNLVGDTPDHGFIPGVSELVKNGRVYNSKESAQLIKSGRVKVAKSFAFGGGGEDAYTSPIKPVTYTQPKVTTAISGNKPGGGGGSYAAAVSNNVTMQATKQAAEMQVQTQSVASQAQTQIANMVSQLQQSQAAAQSVFEEMLSVMRSDNPRAIGKQVSYELAKVF